MSKLYIPTCIYQEENCVKKYGSEMKGLGKHAFIVTGKHSAKTNGSLADVEHVLRELGDVVVHGVAMMPILCSTK